MPDAPAKRTEQPTPATIEDVLIRGDLSKLTEAQRTEYYMRVCHSLGLNPLTRPFDYLTLSGKLVLYAKRDAADQLRKINGISIEIVSRDSGDGLLTVHARARDKTGRTDEDFGVVAFKGGGGDFAANAWMKAVTKAKRRVTLSISGLGLLDETEVGAASDVDEPDGEVISQQHLQTLITECDETGTDKRKLCEYFGAASMAELTPDQFAEAMALLKRKRAPL